LLNNPEVSYLTMSSCERYVDVEPQAIQVYA